MRKLVVSILSVVAVVALVATFVDAQPTVGITKTAPLSGNGNLASPLKLDVCSSGSGYQSNGTSWACAVFGDITSVGATSGGGLTGGSTSGPALLGLLTTCATDEVLAWDGDSWECAAGGFAYGEAESHADLAAGNHHDLTPTNWATVVRHYIAGDDALGSTITGFGPLPVGTVRLVELGDRNSHGPLTVLSYEDSVSTGSLGGNRIVTPDNASLKIDPGGMFAMIYIGGGPLHGWRVIWSTTTVAPRAGFNHVRFYDSIAVTLASGATHDLAPTGGLSATRWRVTVATTGSTLTGITGNSASATPNIGSGEWRIIENVGDGSLTPTSTLTLAHVGSGSFGYNSFYNPNGADVVLPPNGSAIFVHDATLDAWRMVASTATANTNKGPALTPSALASGDTNDWNPTGFLNHTRIRVTPNAAGSTLTGMAAGRDGEIKILEVLYAPGGSLTLAEYRTSSGVNRFVLPGLVDLVIQPGGTAIVVYDKTLEIWKAAGVAGVAGTTYTAGDSLDLTGTDFDLNMPGASCGAGQHVSAISSTGTGTCTASGSAYTAGDGITLNTLDFDLDLSTGGGLEINSGAVGMLRTCSSLQYLAWIDPDSEGAQPYAWTCTSPAAAYITAVSSDFTVTGTTLDLSTAVTAPGTLSVAGLANSNTITASNTATGQTSTVQGVQALLSGSTNTTAGSLYQVALSGNATGTRSAGGFDLINVAGYFNASGAQQNLGLWVDFGATQIDETLTVGGTADFNDNLTKFGSSDGAVYMSSASVNGEYATNGTGSLYLNYVGYLGSTGQFRDVIVADGKNATIATFTGSTKGTALAGALGVTGVTTLTGGGILSAKMEVLNDTGKLSTKSAGAITLTNCGGSPTFSGDRSAGFVTMGSAPGSCEIDWTTAFAANPSCSLTTRGSTKTFTYTADTSKIVMTSPTASQIYDWICVDKH